MSRALPFCLFGLLVSLLGTLTGLPNAVARSSGPSSIEVRCATSGAVVWVDGVRLGSIANERGVFSVPHGKRRVEVRAKGYRVFVREFVFVSGMVRSLQVTLRPLVDDSDMLALVPLVGLANDSSAPVQLPSAERLQFEPVSNQASMAPIEAASPDLGNLAFELEPATPWYAHWGTWAGVGAAVAGGVVLTVMLLRQGEESGSSHFDAVFLPCADGCGPWERTVMGAP